MMKGIFIEVFTVVISSVVLFSAGETCEDIQSYIVPTYYDNYYYLWYVGSYYYHYGEQYQEWHNMSFWGGHWQIPTKDNQDYRCFETWGHSLVVLLEKHPEIGNIGNNVTKLDACSLNRNGECQWNMEVDVIACNGDMLYRFSWYDPDNADTWDQYICFDAIYRDTCSDSAMVYSAGNVHGNYLNISYGDITRGWYNGFINGKQYVLASTEDLETAVFDECFQYDWGYVLQEPVPQTITETPARLAFCYVNKYFNDDSSYYIENDDDGNCHNYVYARACNGKIQFDLSHMETWGYEICFIHKNNVFANPEIRHDVASVTTDGVTRKTYTPFLQYRCSFEMTHGVSYKVNWYINGTWQLQTGPSSLLDDLVFKESFLTDLSPGYEVQCSVIALPGNESAESFSDVYFAGWKISDSSISLSKSGFAFVTLEQTIPLGCYYTDSETPQCNEELSVVDPSYNPNSCAGTVRAQDTEDPRNLNIAVKSVKKGEEWTSKKYKFKLSTIDNDYDDKTKFDLEESITRRSGIGHQIATAAEIIGTLRVDITDTNSHWNKRCYSHVDPHHKTSDGQHFEMQREGDHIMYINEAYQSEIQQSARYCYPGWSDGPICACGIAIRVGADAFVFNACPDSSFMFDYFRKEKESKIDIEKRDDYHYKVRTPIGTIVDIYMWGKLMNIDIYMAAKDFDNVVGLCGYFDGDRSNDLRHRDGITVSYDNNWNYEFSDSWKLTDEENLFTNRNRVLEPWKDDNAGGSGQSCSRPNSITKKKGEATRRKKRSLTNRHGNKQEKQYVSRLSVSRTKRSAGNFTEDEAFNICNESIYLAPSVQEFPDKLGEEDPDTVVQQCVYDLTQGNDTQWVDAHITVLNNAADAILQLNPVFVANNSDMVKSYLTKICLNNCSQNGVCTESGNCECNGIFRGPDCSIDIRIPPIVYEVQGGDICDTDDGDDCACHQIRTNNIFDGFFCQMIKNKVYFNGTSIKEGNTTFEGDYHDIFTGVCCYTDDRKKRSSDDNDITVTMYVFLVSNDGNNYGEPNTVYTYQTTCIEQSEINGTITFELKPGFCYIDGVCVIHNDKVLSTDECYLCDPSVDPFNWTISNCEETDNTGLGTLTLVGIIIGSCIAVAVTGVLFYLLCLKGYKKDRSIHDSHTNLQSTLASIHLPQSCKPDAAKPVSKRNMWITGQSFPNIERSLGQTEGGQDIANYADIGIDEPVTDARPEQHTLDGVTTISVKSFEK